MEQTLEFLLFASWFSNDEQWYRVQEQENQRSLQVREDAPSRFLSTPRRAHRERGHRLLSGVQHDLARVEPSRLRERCQVSPKRHQQRSDATDRDRCRAHLVSDVRVPRRDRERTVQETASDAERAKQREAIIRDRTRVFIAFYDRTMVGRRPPAEHEPTHQFTVMLSLARLPLGHEALAVRVQRYRSLPVHVRADD